MNSMVAFFHGAEEVIIGSEFQSSGPITQKFRYNYEAISKRQGTVYKGKVACFSTDHSYVKKLAIAHCMRMNGLMKSTDLHMSVEADGYEY